MLTQMRDQFRAQGFEAEMNAEAVSVQVSESEEEEAARTKMVAECRSKAENGYRCAEKMSELLAKLPKPKKEASS